MHNQENTSDKWEIAWYPTRKCFINILYHATENTMANTINAAHNGKAEFNTVKDTAGGLSFFSVCISFWHGINHKYILNIYKYTAVC